MFRERLYGYGFGVAAGLATIGAVAYPDLTPWLVLLVVLIWAARRRAAPLPPLSEAEGAALGWVDEDDDEAFAESYYCRTNEDREVWYVD